VRSFSSIFLAFALLVLTAHPSLAADIRVYASGAPAEVVRVLAAKFSDASGHRVLVTSGTIVEVEKKLADGETPDVIILPAPSIAALDKAGKLDGASRTDIARVGVGVAVRAGTPLPDIASADAIRKLLLDAGSIVHPDPVGGGFAGAQIARMMTRLGVADAVKPKTFYRFAIGGGTAAVANGEAAVGLFNISEILPAKGVTLVGPLPPELQSWITFAGARLAGSAASEPALAFLRALAEAGAASAWTAGGFDPLGGR
jgi:molybdate transport system substrate-binding protein